MKLPVVVSDTVFAVLGKGWLADSFTTYINVLPIVMVYV
jgi:hypothetical protein